VKRIPRVLYHRAAPGPRARCRADPAVAESYRAAAARHYAALGITGAVVTLQPDGTVRAIWEQEWPRVAIIIPTKDQGAALRRCIDGLLSGTDYPDIELILVDNDTTEDAARALLDDLAARGAARVVCYPGRFNYADACNRGAAVASAPVLLFLNNDVGILERDWLRELVRTCLLPGVGIAGSKLIYTDGSLQHAGVALGLGLFGLLYNGAKDPGWGVFGSPEVRRNVSAVMGACQMIRREAFEAAGGFDTTLQLAHSDVTLCLRAIRAGWRVAYTPFAPLLHAEGLSRGRDDSPVENRQAAQDLVALGFHEDPYFHPLLDPASTIPRLRRLGDQRNRGHLRSDVTLHQQSLLDQLDLPRGGEGLREFVLGFRFWPPVSRVTGMVSAARWLIDLLRVREDLRIAYPDALSAGVAGSFGSWLRGAGRREFPWLAEAMPALEAALAVDFTAAMLAFFQGADREGLLTWADAEPAHAAALQFVVLRGISDPVAERARCAALDAAALAGAEASPLPD
jgi:GT2 family glycosyltransferase